MNKISYLKKLLQFAYKHNPILGIYPIISTFSIGTELLAMMTLLPLSTIATGQAFNSKDPIIWMLNFVNIHPTPKAVIMTFCLLFILRISTNVTSQAIALKYGKRVLSQLASKAFSNITKHFPLEEIEKKSIGHYISLAGDESFRASTIVIEIHQLISITILGTLYFSLIFWYSPVTAISVLGFLAFSLILMSTTFKRTHKLGELQISQSKSATSIFLDALNGLRTVRSLNAEDYVVNAYRNGMYTYSNTLFQIDFINILIKFVPIAVLFVLLTVFMMTSFEQYVGEKLNFAFVITMILFLMRFFPVVGQGLNVLMRLISDSKAARDVTEIIELLEEKADGNLSLNDKITKISTQDIIFSYKDTAPVFKNLTVNFEAGKSYALIGPSGIGKSTFFNILAFLNKFNGGDILVNDKPYQEYKKVTLRREIILVEQESIIFNDTIFNNINLGENYSLDEVKNACKLACIDDFIDSLPEKYDYHLNYQGQNFSGGQRQRIGIARAILRNPSVLLLDEVTSALDEATKRKIVENVLDHFKHKIVIFIAHDQIVTELVDITFDLDKKQLIQNNIHAMSKPKYEFTS